ncbi:Helix-loop-helix protein 14 [Caenorhabditis elegans]|uniref:Helix-loop-helix protein 14 n=1 Tax=Caenorhabditis elegans TaxID=6239 RepID=HLH14_CAEEL|nr:Helix-loop-helix protein 14 [Caenorhabditis elegans]Q09961.3 RecName: Full=Helix-loop-helix protein 14 [Caenorhabditis elegans]CCD65023.2 Helix-loop-helix protein 14 [Caenorhabditis elegans]|eukprot:NP_495131.3 Helix Loop Helix [Caenorhabditis elegans]
MAKKNQVARNERERKRVHQVNHGFDVLRNRLQPKNHTKKWSKADTLREAVKYIQQLQVLLNQDPQQPSVSSSTPDYTMNNSNNFNNYAVKEEFSMYLPQNYCPQNQMSVPHGDVSHNFNSPTSSVSSSSYSPTQMCYPPVSYSNYPHH